MRMSETIFFQFLLGVVLVQAQHPVASALNKTDTLKQVFADYFQWKLRSYPEWASLEGFEGFNHLVEDYTLDAVKAKEANCSRFLDRSSKLLPTNKNEEIYQNIFEAEIRPCISGMKHKGYLLPPVNFLEGIQVEYPLLVSDPKKTKLGSLKDYEDLLTRIRGIPGMIDQIIILLKEGMKEGVTYAKESLGGVDLQFERLQVQVNASDFYIRFRDMPGSLGRHVVDRLKTSAYKVVEEEVLPAFKRLQDFLRYEYSTAYRAEPGISSTPGGADFYSSVLRWHISTNQDHQQVHNVGLEEVAKIQEGVKEVMQQLGQNVSFREFASLIRNDLSQEFSSQSEALATYQKILMKVNPKLSKLFPAETITDAVRSLEVAASPLAPGGAIAYYESGTPDGSRPGRFYVKLDPLSAQKTYEATTLTLHEGNPGHHFQWVFNKNQKDIPQFITSPMFSRYSEAPSRFNMPTAHLEGWGLYSEFLGFELGLYEDPYARFGHYSFNLLRACRLVVDTGMHAMGWSREKAVNYMLENTAMSKDSVEAEIDRYITWPGQACAYKIGERKIKSLRSSAEEQLGDTFSIAEFHRAVLQCVGPMSVLETCIERFVSSVKSNTENIRTTDGTVQSPMIHSGGNGTNVNTCVVHIVTLVALFVRQGLYL